MRKPVPFDLLADKFSHWVMDVFREAGALLEGHFLLSSGLHSRYYLQCARAMMLASRGEKLCQALSEKVTLGVAEPPNIIVAPAMGGVLVGYEMGRQLKVPSVFLERVEGTFRLRRGFSLPKNARCLIVEDIVTTGLSLGEVVKFLEGVAGAKVCAAACLIDRSENKLSFPFPLFSLAKLSLPTYKPENLPEDLQAIPVVKPGSRGMV